MVFQEMQAELSELIAESSTRTFSTDQRKRWLNQGVVQVCRATFCLEKKATKNVTAATREYDLVTDWSLTDFLAFAPAGIVHYNGSATAPVYTTLEEKKLEWLDENMPGWRNDLAGDQSDTPAYFVRYGQSKVLILPTPKTSVTSGFIIYYHYYPIQSAVKGGLINGTDVPFSIGATDMAPHLEPYHHLPVLYAGYRALRKAGVPKAREVLEEYTGELRVMKAQLSREPAREPRVKVFNYRAR